MPRPFLRAAATAALVALFSAAPLAQQPELLVQTGHAAAVTEAVFSPDGRLVATAGDDSSVRLWEAASGRELRAFTGALDVNALAFSPDGRMLAAASEEKTVYVWDILTGRALLASAGHADAVTAVAFSRDGRLLASASRDRTVKLWEVASAREVSTLRGHTVEVSALAFSPADGHLLASAGTDLSTQDEASETSLNYERWPARKSELKVWDIRAGAALKTFGGKYKSIISALAYSPDGRTLASAEIAEGDRSERTIRLWDTLSGDLAGRLVGDAVSTRAVAFSPDGKTLVSAGSNKQLPTAKLISGRPFDRSPGCHESERRQREYGAAKDRGWRLGAGDDEVVFWNLTTHKVTRRVKNFGRAALSPDWKTMAAWGGEEAEAVRLLDVATLKEIGTLGGKTPPANLVAGTEGRTIRWGRSGGRVNLWSLPGGKSRLVPVVGSCREVTPLAVSWDGTVMAAQGVGADGITLLKTLTGEVVQTLKTHGSNAAFTRDGRFLITGGRGDTRLWDLATNKLLASFDASDSYAEAFALSPDDKTVAVTEVLKDGVRIKLHDLEAGSSKTIPMPFPKDDVLPYAAALAFSPDGLLLAAAYAAYDGKGGQFGVWHVATGEPYRPVAARPAGVTALSFAPDGKRLLLGAADGTLGVWDVEAGRALRNLETDLGRVLGVHPLSGGTVVSVLGSDGRAKLFALESGEELATLIGIGEEDWLVATPDGFFDGTHRAWGQVYWRLSENTFDVKPVEMFFKDYHVPGLLNRLLAGERFRGKPLSSLNRAQPEVKIVAVEPQAGDAGSVNVVVEVGRTGAAARVHDLRLLLDGQVVGYAPEEGGEVKLDSASGTARVTFKNILLPHKPDSAAVTFAAYAFNDAGVRSTVETKTYQAGAGARGGAGRVFIISVGVNAHENPSWNLEYAANDARQFQRVLGDAVGNGGRGEVVRIMLTSEVGTNASAGGAGPPPATKANIKAVFDLLAGREAQPAGAADHPEMRKLTRARPEDIVLFTFSGHGQAEADGEFYLLPSDIGAGERRVVTKELLARSISTRELSLWLKDVAAGEMVMIVDACQSAAAVGADQAALNPMSGGRSLGQLAFEKKMRILAATQADDVALEVSTLKHGLLSYALVEDGLRLRLGDFSPRDGVVTLKEWLEYGAQRVPGLGREVASGQLSTQPAGRGAKIVHTGAAREATAGSVTQQPTLYDFSDGRREVVLATGGADDFRAIGLSSLAAGRFEEAARAFRREVELRPQRADAHLSAGQAHFGAGQYQEAEQSLRRALSLWPGRAEAHHYLGQTLEMMEKYEEAAAEYRRAVSLDPSRGEPRYHLGRVLIELGEYSEAVGELREALRLRAADEAEVRYALGVALFKEKDLPAAREQLAVLKGLDPQAAERLDRLSRILVPPSLPPLSVTRIDDDAPPPPPPSPFIFYGAQEVDQKARVIVKPEPVYTEAAKQNGTEGVVKLRAVFMAGGSVEEIEVVEGLPDGLTESAVAAARKITFEPALKNGRKVSQRVTLEYNFSFY